MNSTLSKKRVRSYQDSSNMYKSTYLYKKAQVCPPIKHPPTWWNNHKITIPAWKLNRQFCQQYRAVFQSDMPILSNWGMQRIFYQLNIHLSPYTWETLSPVVTDTIVSLASSSNSVWYSCLFNLKLLPVITTIIIITSFFVNSQSY